MLGRGNLLCCRMTTRERVDGACEKFLRALSTPSSLRVVLLLCRGIVVGKVKRVEKVLQKTMLLQQECNTRILVVSPSHNNMADVLVGVANSP